jgi:two-component system, chemotaxis family, chemotaxis protein CheY
MKVLVVDDSSFIREYMHQFLDLMGASCEEAANGSDALDLLKAHGAFDLMLLDMNMPVMNGLECMKTIRRSNLYPQMKVILVTAESDRSSIQRAMDLGADDFLRKPFTPDLLLQKMTLLGFSSCSPRVIVKSSCETERSHL